MVRIFFVAFFIVLTVSLGRKGMGGVHKGVVWVARMLLLVERSFCCGALERGGEQVDSLSHLSGRLVDSFASARCQMCDSNFLSTCPRLMETKLLWVAVSRYSFRLPLYSFARLRFDCAIVDRCCDKNGKFETFAGPLASGAQSQPCPRASSTREGLMATLCTGSRAGIVVSCDYAFFGSSKKSCRQVAALPASHLDPGKIHGDFVYRK